VTCLSKPLGDKKTKKLHDAEEDRKDEVLSLYKSSCLMPSYCNSHKPTRWVVKKNCEWRNCVVMVKGKRKVAHSSGGGCKDACNLIVHWLPANLKWNLMTMPEANISQGLVLKTQYSTDRSRYRSKLK